MKAVISRVGRASVAVDDQVVGAIGKGLLVYIGIVEGDGNRAVESMAQKLVSMRLFSDESGKINLNVGDVDGEMLLIPNFTLAGRTSKGTRPSFADAAEPALARELFQKLTRLIGASIPVELGQFGADMAIESVAQGPVTLTVEVT